MTELLAGVVAGARAGLPESIKGAVWARMARLCPRGCELLEAISVAPGAAVHAVHAAAERTDPVDGERTQDFVTQRAAS